MEARPKHPYTADGLEENNLKLAGALCENPVEVEREREREIISKELVPKREKGAILI